MEGGDNRGRVNGGIPKGMNMSLDDLISARKTNNKQSTVGTTNTPRRQQLLPRRPRGAIQKRGSHPWDTNTEEESHYRRLARPTAAAPTLRITTNVRGAPGSSSRIVQSAAPLTRLRISNIHHGVSREDLENLFSVYGAVERASLRYDISGRSLGEAEVQFEDEEEAQHAFKAYNGKPLDGQVLVIERTTAIEQHLTRKTVPRGPTNYFRGSSRSRVAPFRRQGKRSSSTGISQKQATSAEQLDADLDTYMQVE